MVVRDAVKKKKRARGNSVHVAKRGKVKGALLLSFEGVEREEKTMPERRNVTPWENP